MTPMTPKQRTFADEYLVDFNATRAYKVAYPASKSESTIASNASRLLNSDKVHAYIAEKMDEITSKKIADAKEVMETLTRVLRREEKENVVVTLKSRSSDYDKHGKKRIIEKEEPTLVEMPAKISDVNKAAELLGRRYSLFTDRVSIEGEGLVTIVNDIPEDGNNDPAE